jgi:protein tyrosine phosphatase (PTP) superfamily phosphohydrolase (DUF442 family)
MPLRQAESLNSNPMTAVKVLPYLSVALLAGLIGCGERPVAKAPATAQAQGEADEAAAKPTPTKIELLTLKHLPNPVRVHEKVISGGLPEGDAAFEELKQLGIKTIITVDGAKPDVATAKKFGLRYVHLPHGYDGVPEARAQELAKAVRDLPGPIYIHCHHGHHRSPAATAVACVGAGLIDHDAARLVLQVAGTSEAYRGLFQSVDAAHAFEKHLLDELQADFPPIAKLPAMAEAMVEIEHIHDRLKAIEKAGWQTPADQPALVPDHEALLLREQFTEMLRTKELASRPEAFRELVQEGEGASLALEEALKSGGVTNEEASRLLAAVSKNCKTCHQRFRDVPLKEKAGK